MAPRRLASACSVTLFCIFLWAGCNSGNKTATMPTAPTPPAPTTLSVSVAISNEIIVRGTSETATATLTLSNGTTTTGAGGGWTSDNSTIASIDGTGRITGNTAGRTTINFTSQGVSGSRFVRVVPNYVGQWSGSYVVRGCDQTSVFVTIRFCSDSFPVNRVLPINLTLTQGSRDVVSGRFFLGTIQSDTFTAAVETDGAIQFSGIGRSGDFTIDAFWRINSLQEGRIVGGLTQTWRATGFTGQGNVAAEVRDLNR